MPTPIEHLTIAERVVASPALPEWIRTRLIKNDGVRAAFYFGHIAPDVQVISRQPREETHFFTIPLMDRRPPYKNMLAQYPSLANASRLPLARAAFIAGYVSYLLLDELWVREIFQPIFGPEQAWGDWQERLLLHNVLRAWLDRRESPNLPSGIGDLLRLAEPDDWLPFANDVDLGHWRDLVAEQLAPGAAIRTVEIFANRARIPNKEFVALLEPRVMAERIFSRVELATLDRLRDRAVTGTRELIVGYMNGCAGNE